MSPVRSRASGPVGARAIRVRQGEYAAAPDEPGAWAVTDTFPAAAELALGLLISPFRAELLPDAAVPR